MIRVSQNGRRLQTRSKDKTYSMRISNSVSDLLAIYKLRHSTFHSIGYLPKALNSGLEIDSYDRFAIPLGIFDTNSGSLVATLRIITTHEQPDYTQLIDCILQKCCDDELTDRVNSAKKHPLPAIAGKASSQLVDEFNKSSFPLVEISRLIVHPGCRGKGLSQALMKFALAVSMSDGPKTIVAGVLEKHVAMHRECGFDTLPGSTIELNEVVNRHASTIVCSTLAIPEPACSIVKCIRKQILHGVPQGICAEIPLSSPFPDISICLERVKTGPYGKLSQLPADSFITATQ